MALIIAGFSLLGLVVAIGLSGSFMAWLAKQGQGGRVAVTALVAGVPLALGAFVLVPLFAPSAREVQENDPITHAALQIMSLIPAMLIGALCLGVTLFFLSRTRGRR